MKVIVLGANGLIGSNIVYTLKYFSNRNYDIIAVIRQNACQNFKKHNIHTVVIDDYFNQLELILSKLEPDYVINCVGIVSQNFTNHTKDEVIKWNSYFPHYLHRICQSEELRIIHISTDCVFNVNSIDNYEDSEKFANDTYGKSKSLGEIKSDFGHTVRLSTIGFEHAVTKHGLFEWFIQNAGKSIDGYENAIYSGTSGSEVYRIIDYTIGNWDASSILHFEGYSISKFNLLGILNDALDAKTNVRPVPDPIIKRNLKSSFIGPEDLGLPSWPEQIQNLLKMREFYDR